jgi:UPF0716 protein FxsA
MGTLIIIFILIPLIELSLLLKIGGLIGVFPTLAIVILTGIFGAYLTRSQGFRIWRDINQQMQQGQLPANSMFDGLLVLVGGLTLLTPGFLTDIFGFCCLIPVTRTAIREGIKRLLAQRYQMPGTDTPTRNNRPSDQAIDTEFWVEDDDK